MTSSETGPVEALAAIFAYNDYYLVVCFFPFLLDRLIVSVSLRRG